MRSEAMKSPSPSSNLENHNCHSNDESSSSSSPKSDHHTSQEDLSDSDIVFDAEAPVDQTAFTRFVPLVRNFQDLSGKSEETPVDGTINPSGNTAVDLERNSRGRTYFNYGISLAETLVGVLLAFTKLKVLRFHEAILEKVDLYALGLPNSWLRAVSTICCVFLIVFSMFEVLRGPDARLEKVDLDALGRLNFTFIAWSTIVTVLLIVFITSKVLRVLDARLEKVDLVALGRPNFTHIAWVTVGVVVVLAFIMLKDLRLHEATLETSFAFEPFKFVLKLLFRRDAN